MPSRRRQVRVFAQQHEASVKYLIPHIERLQPKDAWLIQYSAQTVSEVVKVLLGTNCQIRLLVHDPPTAVTQWQYERIWNNVSDLLHVAMDGRNPTQLEIRTYKSPGSIRGIKLDQSLICVNWYTYRPAEPNFAGLRGHDNTLICAEIDQPEGALLDKTFTRAFDWLWSSAEQWVATQHSYSRLPWVGFIEPLAYFKSKSVFLSFRFAESEYIKSLHELLESEGFSVVTGEYANTYISQEILSRIKSCEFFVCLMTKADEKKDGSYTTSSWLLEEKGAALALNKKIVLMVEDGVTDIGGLQGDWQRIHFSAKSFAAAIKRAINQLKSFCT